MKAFWILVLGLCFLAGGTSVASALGVGDTAPDFEAASTQGTIVLSEALAKGPVVLALYYADFTPV